MMGNRDILYPLRVAHGRLHAWREQKSKLAALRKYVKTPAGQKVYILGTPTHTNLGDSAIVLAEKAFLQGVGIDKSHTKELSAGEVLFLQKRLHISRNALIMHHGGGNLGNQWLNEELLHRQLLRDFPNIPTVIFPQTIYYTPDEAGQAEQQKSIPIYNGRKNLTLVARERQSQEIMSSLYPETNILLTPDIVLSATMETFGVKPADRHGVLLCMRSDAERSMSDSERQQILTYLNKCGVPYRVTDMYSDCLVTKENRGECVRKKMEEFTGAELAITDRLHGMIFAAITGTPCIAFSNNNHKVRGTYEWIKYLPYIRYAETAEDMRRYLPELLAMQDCKFDNTPLMPYFEKLAQVVRRYAKN